jgi:hypothetical protein
MQVSASKKKDRLKRRFFFRATWFGPPDDPRPFQTLSPTVSIRFDAFYRCPSPPRQPCRGANAIVRLPPPVFALILLARQPDQVVPRHLKLFFAIVIVFLAPRPGTAQRITPPLGVVAQRSTSLDARLLAAQSSEGTPRWVKWGLVGAVGGGVLFAVAGQSNVEGERNVARDAIYGAAIGFAILGGGVALYDWMCGGDTRSRRSGLCGR